MQASANYRRFGRCGSAKGRHKLRSAIADDVRWGQREWVEEEVIGAGMHGLCRTTSSRDMTGGVNTERGKKVE